MFTGVIFEFYEDHPEDTRKGSPVLGRLISSVEDNSISGTETVIIPGNTQYVVVSSEVDIFVEIGASDVTASLTRRVFINAGTREKSLTVGPTDTTIAYKLAQTVSNNLPLTAFGDLRTAELSPIFQGSFEYTVDNTELTTSTVVNGGTITQASAMAVVGTSTTTASTACLASFRLAKYRAGLGSLLRFTTLFTSGVSGAEQFVGLLDEGGASVAFKNGLAVGYDGTTFGFHRFSNDAITTIEQADWDDPLDGNGASGMTLDATKLNVWAIGFQYLGAGALTLSFEDGTGRLVVVHTIDYSNLNTTPSSFNPNYHFTIWVNNGGTTSDVVVKSSSYGYFVEGKAEPLQTHQPQFSSGLQQKTSVTSEIAIFTIRCKAMYASKTNFIEILLENVSSSIEANSANNLGVIRLVKNASLGGVPSYADINTTDSVVDIDTAGTTITGGKELFSFSLAGKNDKEIFDVLDLKILLLHNETISLAASSINSATVDASFLWKELF